MSVIRCKKYFDGYCDKGTLYGRGYRDKKVSRCSYDRTIEASLSCRSFRAVDDDYSSSIVCVFEVAEKDDFLKCKIGVNTDLSNILLDDVLLTRYQDGFLGYIVKICEARGISISAKLEKEIISEVRKYIKKKV